MLASIRGQKPVNRSLDCFTQPNVSDSHPAETPPACLKKTLHQIQSHGRLWKCTSCPPPPALVAVGERALLKKKSWLKEKGHNETSVIPSFLATLASLRESTIPKPMSLFSRTCAVSWKFTMTISVQFYSCRIHYNQDCICPRNRNPVFGPAKSSLQSVLLEMKPRLFYCIFNFNTAQA